MLWADGHGGAWVSEVMISFPTSVWGSLLHDDLQTTSYKIRFEEMVSRIRASLTITPFDIWATFRKLEAFRSEIDNANITSLDSSLEKRGGR